jgi:hypothetical protein
MEPDFTPLLSNILSAIEPFTPHHILKTLFSGGETTFFDQASFMTYSGWHPQLSFNEMEKGVTFSKLVIPQTYLGQMDQHDKGEFTIFNRTNKTKTFHIEFYQDWCQVTYIKGNARCSYGGEHPMIAPPRIEVIPPGGMREIEFWYSTPPSITAGVPQMGDVMYTRVVIQITDEEGKRTKMSAMTKSLPGAP